MATKTERPDHWVSDPEVWKELGITSMTGYRWSEDPELGFPQAVKVRNRNFRSRRELDAFKQRMLQTAMKNRKEMRKAMSR
jgi:hypothetical protein